jgi:hypothetical protein
VFKVTPSMLREHWGTVTGSEHELGVLDHGGRGDFDEARLPPMEFLDNGGRVYRDVGHPEICTAEASNPLQLGNVLNSGCNVGGFWFGLRPTLA